jgi:hypothetical protein
MFILYKTSIHFQTLQKTFRLDQFQNFALLWSFQGNEGIQRETPSQPSLEISVLEIKNLEMP